ncbi:MAG TPA: oligosaccharide flippase family protein [Candidatus Limnocylindria bacterium]|nr:oligosaccharide flippase family protein [Candidatus Limnocylindria bacterium]
MTETLSGPDVGSRVVRGSIVRLAGFVVVNLLGAVGVAILQRHLGVASYGEYGTVVALIAIVSGVADAGLTATGSRELALRAAGESRRSLLGTLVGVRLVLTTIGMIGCVLFAWAAGYREAMVIGTALAGGGSVLLAVQSALTLPLAVELRNGLLALTELSKQVILLAGIVALALAGGKLVAFLGIQVAVGAGSAAFTAFLLPRAWRVRPRYDREEWLRLIRETLPVAAAAVLAMAYVRMLVVVASLMTSDEQTGLVVASARVVEIAGGLPLLLAGIVLPVAAVAARDDRVRLRYVVVRMTEVALLVGALVALTLSLAAHPFVVLLGGSSFGAAAPVLRIHAIAVATFFVIQAWVVVLIADNRQQAVVRSSFLGLVTVIVIGIPFIALWDARGAAAAAVVADLVNAGALVWSVRRQLEGAWPVPGGYLLKAMTLIGGALTVGWLAPVPDLARAAIGAALLGGGALALRMVPSEVLDALPWRRA